VQGSRYRFALVLATDSTLLGRLRHDALTGNPQETAVAAVEPGPATIRPHQPLSEVTEHMRAHDLSYVIVTDPERHLLGTLHQTDLADLDDPAAPT
jgi:Mg/Co/Ni transporter MgtE